MAECVNLHSFMCVCVFAYVCRECGCVFLDAHMSADIHAYIHNTQTNKHSFNKHTCTRTYMHTDI